MKKEEIKKHVEKLKETYNLPEFQEMNLEAIIPRDIAWDPGTDSFLISHNNNMFRYSENFDTPEPLLTGRYLKNTPFFVQTENHLFCAIPGDGVVMKFHYPGITLEKETVIPGRIGRFGILPPFRLIASCTNGANETFFLILDNDLNVVDKIEFQPPFKVAGPGNVIILTVKDEHRLLLVENQRAEEQKLVEYSLENRQVVREIEVKIKIGKVWSLLVDEPFVYLGGNPFLAKLHYPTGEIIFLKRFHHHKAQITTLKLLQVKGSTYLFMFDAPQNKMFKTKIN